MKKTLLVRLLIVLCFTLSFALLQYKTDSEKSMCNSNKSIILTNRFVTHPVVEHVLTHFDRNEATCQTDGNIEYWYCATCNKFYSDSEELNEITLENTVILKGENPATFIHHEAKAPECLEVGTIEYWECPYCGKYYSDENGEEEISYLDCFTNLAEEHSLIHYEAVEPKPCYVAGNIEFWKCSSCGKYFSDALATTEITYEDTLIESNIPHDYHENGICTDVEGELHFEEPVKITNENYADYNLNESYIGYYAIKNAGNLYWFSEYVNLKNYYENAVLVDDITVNEKVLEEGNLVSDVDSLIPWIPIGDYRIFYRPRYYQGVFDGLNHTISGLYLNEPTSDHVGLFGWAKDGATIKNINIVDSYFYGRNFVAGIVARIEINTGMGSISNCTFEGRLIVSNASAGGVSAECRIKEGALTIENCFINATIETLGDYSSLAGGICGFIQDRSDGVSIRNCISNCTLIGIDGAGIVASFDRKTKDGIKLFNCYYTGDYSTECDFQDDLVPVKKLTIDDIESGVATFILNQGNETTVWYQTIGEDFHPSFDNNRGVVYAVYPECGNEPVEYTNNPEGKKTTPTEHTFENGICTYVLGEKHYQDAVLVTDENYEELGLTSDFIGYYAIGNAGQLFSFAQYVNNNMGSINVVLIDDIDLEGYSWIPIGLYSDIDSYSEIAYKGIFDGNYHVIKNMNVEMDDPYEAGLFGRIEKAKIYNLGIENANVANTAYARSGILTGEAVSSTISNCYTTGVVNVTKTALVCAESGNQANGFAGELYATNTNNCFTMSESLSNNGSEELVGYFASVSNNSELTNCFYHADSEKDATEATFMTTEQFKNGNLAYNLNNKSYTQAIWYQKVDVDAYPTFDSTRGIVYAYYSNCGEEIEDYSNEKGDHKIDQGHEYNANGICIFEDCDDPYKMPEYVDGFYIINNAGELFSFANMVNNPVAIPIMYNAILTRDIDLQSITWTPMGLSGKEFNGKFYGNNHVIYNLNIESSTEASSGFFGKIYNATIENLGIVDAVVNLNKTDRNINSGIMFGEGSYSLISNCYTTGIVNVASNLAASVNGFSGQSVECLFIRCFTTATFPKIIESAVSYGKFDSTSTSIYENCFYMSSEDDEMARTEADFRNGKVTYYLNNLNVTNPVYRQNIGDDSLPSLDPNKSIVYRVYTIICNDTDEVYSNTEICDIANDDFHHFENGICRNENCPYIYQTALLITLDNYEENNLTSEYIGYYAARNAGQLFYIANLINRGANINVVLLADIDLEGLNWTPLTQNRQYKGVFDGNFHTISDFYIKTNNDSAVGFFGYIFLSTIKNLGLVNAIVETTTTYYAGILVGQSWDSTISNCFVTGKITIERDSIELTEYQNVFVGDFSDTVISNCFSTATGIVKNREGTNNLNFICKEEVIFDNGARNCYFLDDVPYDEFGVKSLTEEEMASGYLACCLNEENVDNPIWRQTIGSDPIPLFDKNHNIVYLIYEDCGKENETYTNDIAKYKNIIGHVFDEDGICTVLPGKKHYQNPVLVTEENYEELGLSSTFIGYNAIGNVGQLFYLAQYINSGKGQMNVVLIEDIDLAGYSWIPIGLYSDLGNYSKLFYEGTFNGNYHVIKNMNVEMNDPYEAGFFGRVRNVNILNLGIENAIVNNIAFARSGILAGETESGNISNCYTSGVVTVTKTASTCAGSGNQANGFVGESKCKIDNCYSEAISTYDDGETTGKGAFAKANSSSCNNCFYLYNGLDADAGTSKTKGQFLNGEVCYLLSSGDSSWGQNVGEDSFPSFKGAKPVVVKNGIIHNHEYDNSCDTDCNICGEERTITHTLVHHPYTNATCTTNGSKEHWACSVCGGKYSNQEGTIEISDVDILCTGHIWDTEMTIDIAPTYTSDGEKSYHCDKCDERKEITAIPKITYKLQYINGNIIEEEVLSVDGSITLKSPEKEGYTFVGWYSNESGEEVLVESIDCKKVTGNISLYAKWSSDSNAGLIIGITIASVFTLLFAGLGISYILWRKKDILVLKFLKPLFEKITPKK